jgi:hypothetical protein
MSSYYDDSAGLPQSPAPRAAANPYAQMYRMPAANPSYFNPASYAGAGGNYGIPYNGRPMAGDVGFSKQPSYPNLGYNSSFSSLYAQPAYNNAFASRFGQWGMGAGTPAAVPAANWYGGLPGGANAYNSWNMGLPAQGGLGVPGSGGGGPGIYANSPFGTGG